MRGHHSFRHRRPDPLAQNHRVGCRLVGVDAAAAGAAVVRPDGDPMIREWALWRQRSAPAVCRCAPNRWDCAVNWQGEVGWRVSRDQTVAARVRAGICPAYDPSTSSAGPFWRREMRRPRAPG